MATPLTEIVKANVIASSVTSKGARVDTIHVRYPRLIHAEVMTHRVFSRNAASSRAIPVASLLGRDEMYVPLFKHNKKGMQPAKLLSPENQLLAEAAWVHAANECRAAAGALSRSPLNVHKQWANRMLEWFTWIDVLITSSQWANFFALRLDEDAQEEIRMLARAVWYARQAATPKLLKQGGFTHLPYVRDVDLATIHQANNDWVVPGNWFDVLHQLDLPRLSGIDAESKIALAVSAARCCRLSYGKVDGGDSTLEEDLARFLQLAGGAPIHASPLEHQCWEPFLLEDDRRVAGNLPGFVQFRKTLPFECADEADPQWQTPFQFSMTESLPFLA